MLSIYLLLQKNTTKLENLLLIGYSPAKVALFYQLLTLGLNAIVLVLSISIVLYVRGSYMDWIGNCFHSWTKEVCGRQCWWEFCCLPVCRCSM